MLNRAMDRAASLLDMEGQLVWGCSAPFSAFQASDVLAYEKIPLRR
jgi:hypothetical protein